MQRVELLPIDLAFTLALDPGCPSLARPGSTDLTARLRNQILDLPSTDLPWGGFLAISSEPRDVVGTCGFKGAPTPDNAIEIAYFTFPRFEGRGYATAMGHALVALAWANPALTSVCAHTLPWPSASTQVLKKLGMRHLGEVTDPVEGQVWRWWLRRPAAGTLRDGATPAGPTAR
jgi:ribosomal-protein-alanine N-acetyltransferase